jgi:hypothetical protein
MIVHIPATIGRRRRHVALALQPAGAVTALIVASFFLRVALVFGRELQRYLPDEYLYGQLARSLAEGRGARVLGEPVGLPTLLQPILTAPTWLFGDPELAFRLTQCANAAAMSLGAMVVYVLARELGVPNWSAVGAAAVALASPDLLYAGYVTADAFGYLLALLAILAAVRAVARPSPALQAWFIVTAGFATFARAQYVSLFAAAAIAAVNVERGRPGRLVSRHGLLVGLPLLVAAAIVATGHLGRYATLTSFHLAPGTLGWIPASAFVLALAVGAVIVPGAVAWTAHELVRPQRRLTHAFAALSAGLVGTLLLAAALLSSETMSNRFFERYLMIAAPLAAVAFCCWMAESRPWRYVAVGAAGALAIAVARFPLSEYSAGQGRSDSPLLLAVGQLESKVGVGNASLLTALVATACMALAVAAAYGRLRSPEMLAATVAVLALTSVGAHVADRSLSHSVRQAKLGAVADWVDRAHAEDVLLVQTAGGDQAGAMLLTLRNASVTSAALLGPEATPFDGAAKRITVAGNGQFQLGGRPVHRPILLVETATRVVMFDAALLGQAGDFALVRPRHDARAAAVVQGLNHDGWLEGSGSITVYPTGSRKTCRHATLWLSLPPGASVTRLTVSDRGKAREVTIRAGRVTSIAIAANQTARSAGFAAASPRLVVDPMRRPHSVRARVTTITRACISA